MVHGCVVCWVMVVVKPSGLLLEIPDCPRYLFGYGNVGLLGRECVTIVGTRDITVYGRSVISLFLGEFLKDLGIVVVSGLARGVDGWVHRTCLERGIDTIAVVPGGVDSAIPFENRGIWKEIIRNGLVLTEYPKGVRMNKYMFVQRNRILAGMSKSTIVIEAGENSGSLTTAKLALDYNRDVYVVPGNITSVVSKGCNTLAQQGANILTSLSDFKEVVGLFDEQRKMLF